MSGTVSKILCGLSILMFFATSASSQVPTLPLGWTNPNLCGIRYGFPIIVEIFGDKRDLYRIMYYRYKQVDNRPSDVIEQTLLHDAQATSRDAFGGKGGLSCADVTFFGNILTVRVGWRHDLLHAYYIEHNPQGRPNKLYPIYYYPHDHAMGIFQNPNNRSELLLQYEGRQTFATAFAFGTVHGGKPATQHAMDRTPNVILSRRVRDHLWS